jgi:CTP:molybdopterin cytidylyltransferase MocA
VTHARSAGPSQTPPFAVVVLAAGGGRRYGATKQLAEVAGRPLVEHAVAAAHMAGADRVVVVVGHDAPAVAAAARRAGSVEVVGNAAFGSGMASSLAAGVRALLRPAAAGAPEVAVVLLADQPDVTATAIRSVAAALRPDRGPGGARPDAARACYPAGPGHPVAFRRAAWSRLLTLRGDVGARYLLEDLQVVEVPVDGPRPVDVDTLADLERARTSTAGVPPAPK